MSKEEPKATVDTAEVEIDVEPDLAEAGREWLGGR